MQQNYTNALDKLMQNPQSTENSKQRKVPQTSSDIGSSRIVDSGSGNNTNAALNERLGELEQTINLRPVSSDVYKRIKDIESRIMYLETVSPEYNKFMVSFLE